MALSMRLPDEQGHLVPYELVARPSAPPQAGGFVSRIAYAAAHVAANPSGGIDWEATMAFRRYLWSLGFKLAEAMDTSQRGMGLDWQGAKELIVRSLGEAKGIPRADLAAG